MKLVSWNVNGIRACITKGFEESFAKLDADIFCLQETKCQENQVKLELPGYHQYWNYANRKGYSGTAVFTKKEPLSVTYGLGIEEHDKEGRVITAEMEDFYLVTVYTPNSQSELRRLEYRMEWERDFLAYLLKLQEKKPVICCGDMNVAHQEIDLKNPKTNRMNAGFLGAGAAKWGAVNTGKAVGKTAKSVGEASGVNDKIRQGKEVVGRKMYNGMAAVGRRLGLKGAAGSGGGQGSGSGNGGGSGGNGQGGNGSGNATAQNRGNTTPQNGSGQRTPGEAANTQNAAAGQAGGEGGAAAAGATANNTQPNNQNGGQTGQGRGNGSAGSNENVALTAVAISVRLSATS